MRSAREQEALSIHAQGRKQAQIIRAQADAEAARTYARALARTPISTISTGRCSPTAPPSFAARRDTNIILSPQNDYLKEFSGRAPIQMRSIQSCVQPQLFQHRYERDEAAARLPAAGIY